jgi:hypothetical protein
MSTLNVANITDGTDTVETGYVINGSAKAWVNFDGTGTVAIRDSLNFSSITDAGVGDYDAYYTNGFVSASYTVSGLSNGSGSSNASVNLDGLPQTNLLKLRCIDTTNARNDSSMVGVATIGGDLA